MEHRTMLDGTAYAVKVGRAMMDGTVYEVKTGRTMVEGTVRELVMTNPITVVIAADNVRHLSTGVSIKIDGVAYKSVGTWVFESIGSIRVENLAMFGGIVLHNKVETPNPYTFVPEGELVTIHVRAGTPSHYIDITTE